MSEDFKTFAALTSQGQPFEVPALVPKTDLNELINLGASQGLGQALYDDGDADDAEFRDTLSEFGIKPPNS
jgi:hypothetical protein